MASVLGIASVIQVIGSILTQSLALLGPQLIAGFHLSPAQFGLLLSSVNMGLLVAFLLGGYAADRFDARRVLVLSAFVSGLFVAIAGLARSALLLELVLVMAGAAWGVSVPAGGGAVVRIAPPDRRGLFVSIRQLGLPVGGSLAAVVIPIFAAWGHWNAIFLIDGILFIAAGIVAIRTGLPRRQPQHNSAARSLPARQTLLLGMGGALVGAGQWVFIGYLTYDLTSRLRLSFGVAAAIFLGMQLAGGLGRLFVGWASDFVTSRLSCLIATSIASAGCLLAFGLLERSTPVPVVVGLSAVTGFVIMGWNGVLVAAFAEAGPRALASTSIGAGLLLNRVGVLTAPPVFGVVLGFFTPSLAWMTTAVVMVLAAGIFALLRMWMPAVHPTWNTEA